jgi:hypothetical protein
MGKSVILIGVFIITGYVIAGPKSISEKPSGKRLEFRLVAVGDYVDEDATEAGFRTFGLADTHLGSAKYTASNGDMLITYGCEFRSPQEAKRYLDWKVARSSKTVRRGVKTDASGKSVGYRAVVLLAPDQKQSEVMWTSGPFFREIIGTSLADAEEFEKQTARK